MGRTEQADLQGKLQPVPSSRGMRRLRNQTQKIDDQGHIPATVSISDRPAAVEDRAVLGHWEGDLLCGTGPTQIATLVDRQSRYVVLVKTPSRMAIWN